MYALNFFDTTATRNVLRAMLLTAACVLGMLIAYYAAAVVLPVIVAALTAVASFVVTVASAVLSAAAYAVTVALWCAVRCVIVLALIRALPVLWRASVVVWAHRDGLLVVGRGLVLCAVVVSVFVVALVWLPAIIAGCCTVLPQAGIVAGVFGGVVGLMKVG